MIRTMGEGTNDYELFFEKFKTISHYGGFSVMPAPFNVETCARIVRLPYGNLALNDCAHDYARGLMIHDNEIWVVAVCRGCEHVAPPVFAELR